MRLHNFENRIMCTSHVQRTMLMYIKTFELKYMYGLKVGIRAARPSKIHPDRAEFANLHPDPGPIGPG